MEGASATPGFAQSPNSTLVPTDDSFFERFRSFVDSDSCENDDCLAANSRSSFISSHLNDDDYGPSSCGAFAVWATLSMLGFDNFEKHRLTQLVGIRRRVENACLSVYLKSRANAGCTAAELLNAICRISHQAIGGKFFATWPTRKVRLHRWLSFWIRNGAVPVLTLNLQKRLPEETTPIADAWHHDVAFAISHKPAADPLIHTISHPTGIKESKVLALLDSDSVLLIRRSDVISRYQPSTGAGEVNDLENLCDSSVGWDRANVLGQVINMLREESFRHLGSLASADPNLTSHLSIPASYKAGITLVARQNSSLMEHIQAANTLPLL